MCPVQPNNWEFSEKSHGLDSCKLWKSLAPCTGLWGAPPAGMLESQSEDRRRSCKHSLCSVPAEMAQGFSTGTFEFFTFSPQPVFAATGVEADIPPWYTRNGWGTCAALTAAAFLPCPRLGQPCWCVRCPNPGTGVGTCLILLAFKGRENPSPSLTLRAQILPLLLRNHSHFTSLEMLS